MSYNFLLFNVRELCEKEILFQSNSQKNEKLNGITSLSMIHTSFRRRQQYYQLATKLPPRCQFPFPFKYDD